MCRSIKTLRVLDEPAPDDEVRAAALQYVRKVSGYRHPSPANEHAFNHAVDEIARDSSRLLDAVTATTSVWPRALIETAASCPSASATASTIGGGAATGK